MEHCHPTLKLPFSVCVGEKCFRPFKIVGSCASIWLLNATVTLGRTFFELSLATRCPTQAPRAEIKHIFHYYYLRQCDNVFDEQLFWFL